MATKLTKPVSRETAKTYGNRPIILTIAPARGQNEALISLRRKGERTGYLVALSDLFRVAAMWHGQKEAKARRDAKRNGIPWKQARKAFIRQNSIPAYTDIKTEPPTAEEGVEE